MGNGNFLVVEDEGLVARCLAKMIRPFGQAFPAPTVRQADVLLGGNLPWTALFFDLRLPDGCGLDVLVRARARHPLVPAMVLTAHHLDEAANTAHDLDADYVIKPVEGARIARFLQRASSGSPAAAGAVRADLDRVVEEAIAEEELSAAEGDILRRAARGETREEIAEARGSSRQTINTQVRDILRRTGDSSLREAVNRLRQTARLSSIPGR
jgi:DNA-binding NarL/FixJ family response regulator